MARSIPNGCFIASLMVNMPHNDDFSVKVRAVGGTRQEFFKHTAQADMHNVRDRVEGLTFTTGGDNPSKN
jgi:hypothetical protein